MTRGRKGNEEKIKQFLANAFKNKNYDIYNSSGKPSPSKVVELIKKETGITLTRQTVAKYISSDLTDYKVEVDFSKNSKIIDITEAMGIAKGIYTNDSSSDGDKTKALNSWKQLNQQLIDYEKHLRELEMRKIEASKPNYLIKIEPGCAEHVCPKCKHKFYVGVGETNDDIEKEIE